MMQHGMAGAIWGEQEGKRGGGKKDVARGLERSKRLFHRLIVLSITESAVHVEAR